MCIPKHADRTSRPRVRCREARAIYGATLLNRSKLQARFLALSVQPNQLTAAPIAAVGAGDDGSRGVLTDRTNDHAIPRRKVILPPSEVTEERWRQIHLVPLLIPRSAHEAMTPVDLEAFELREHALHVGATTWNTL